MYSYINGQVSQIKSSSIVIENNGIGYEIHVADPFKYQLNSQTKVYLYQQVREDINRLFGFIEEIEKDLFLKLISVNGVGPKTALNFFVFHDASQIIDAIETSNLAVLKSVPGIGAKTANQIILDIQGKFASDNTSQKIRSNYDAEVVEVLQAMGYKAKAIDTALRKIDEQSKQNVDTYIKIALKKMMEK